MMLIVFFYHGTAKLTDGFGIFLWLVVQFISLKSPFLLQVVDKANLL
jgi:hypothetical protein